MAELPDIQQTKPKIEIPISQVGVQNVKVPFMLESRGGGFHQMIADVSMRTSLLSSRRGISMSRLHMTLSKYLNQPLKHKLIFQILSDLAGSQDEKESFMSFDFKLPMSRTSPATNHAYPLYYDCKFEGSVTDYDQFSFFQGVRVQYASYCPCSAALSMDLKGKGKKGFPHAQRSYADVVVKIDPPNYVWLEDIIETVESNIATLPYPIIKRPDEQEIARIAAENPMFVEDAIRLISLSLFHKKDYVDWIVKCTHEESIHTSEAIAMNWKGVPGGFDGTYYF